MNRKNNIINSHISISRRLFNNCIVFSAAHCILQELLLPNKVFAKNPSNLYRADYSKSLPKGKTKCLLCPSECERFSGEIGLCHTRINQKGTLYTLVYGLPSIIALDRIEKSPL